MSAVDLEAVELQEFAIFKRLFNSQMMFCRNKSDDFIRAAFEAMQLNAELVGCDHWMAMPFGVIISHLRDLDSVFMVKG